MPTLTDKGSWCTTPKNLEFTDSTVNFKMWIGDVATSVGGNLSECIFPLEGKILFFGADVQNPSLGDLSFHLLKNGSTHVAELNYDPSESGIKGAVIDEEYFVNDWWIIEVHKTGPGFVVRAGLMLAGKL